MIGKYKPKGPVGQFVNSLEETVIAALLGAMTMLTFFNVILRYAFNSSLIWSQEVVLVLFAWLVLFGVSYAFKVRGRSFFETDQIPMPEWLRFLEDWINYGEHYSKMPRMIPYLILPISAALILFRVCQATLRIWNNQSESLIVSHEVEDAIEEVAAMNRGE